MAKLAVADQLRNPALLVVLCAPFAGSFLGVLIRRLPHGQAVALARSRCERCGTALRPRDLVPIASYLLLQGRCRSCGGRIAAFHVAMELAALAIAVVVAAAAPTNTLAAILPGCVLGWTLLALAWIDWERLHLPDALTLPLLLAGLAEAAWLAPDDLPARAAGAAAGYAALRGLAVAYRALRKRDGIGGGDAKLLAAGGAWLGLAALPTVLLSAALCGLALAAARASRGPRLSAATAVPFGPALALAIWGMWLLQLRRS